MINRFQRKIPTVCSRMKITAKRKPKLKSIHTYEHMCHIFTNKQLQSILNEKYFPNNWFHQKFTLILYSLLCGIISHMRGKLKIKMRMFIFK